MSRASGTSAGRWIVPGDQVVPVRVTWTVHGKVYAHSKANLARILPDPRPYTEDELRVGVAARTLHFSAQEVWENSVCLDCGLALNLHPPERRAKARRKHCRAARKKATG